MAGRAQESDSCQVAMLPDCAQCDKYWEAKFEVLRVKLEALREIRDLEKTSIDHRLSAMNEIRGALADQSTKMFTRSEHEAYIRSVDSDIRALRESRAEMSGKASQSSANIALILGIVGLLIGIFAIFHHA